MHLTQRCCHCWKHFCRRHIFWMYSLSRSLCVYKADFISGNRQKSFGAKSGEQGGYSISVIDFWARNCLTERDLWAVALSWWRIQSLGQNQVFLYTRLQVTASVFPYKSLVDCLALWNEFKVNCNLNIEGSYEHFSVSGFDTRDFLGRGVIGCFHWKLLFAFGIILKSPCFIFSDNFRRKLFVSLLERSEHTSLRRSLIFCDET
jgi:hypothetical protein